MSACRRHYPGRTDGTDSLFAAPSASSFPTLQLGRLLHYIFRGLLSVHSRYNLQTRQVALCDPLHRRLRRLCCLHRRSDCYRVERSSSRAGLLPAVDQCLFTAHCNGDVSRINDSSLSKAEHIRPPAGLSYTGFPPDSVRATAFSSKERRVCKTSNFPLPRGRSSRS